MLLSWLHPSMGTGTVYISFCSGAHDGTRGCEIILGCVLEEDKDFHVIFGILGTYFLQGCMTEEDVVCPVTITRCLFLFFL